MNENLNLLPISESEKGIPPATYQSNCYDIVSRVGYLIGVNLSIFQSEVNHLMPERFEELHHLKEARIIRNLSIIRTILLRHHDKLENLMSYSLKNINSIPEYINEEIITRLKEDNVDLWHANWQVDQYLMFVSAEIRARISTCRNLFPIWLNWEYIKELFIIPNLKKEQQLKSIRMTFTNNLSCYPYQMYIYWQPKDMGNILYNDEKFVAQTLYPMHGQTFTDLSKVKGASEATKADIKNFLQKSEKTVLVVDCENSNPYKLYSTLSSLDKETLERIHKIILYNDVHTSVTWKLLNRFVSGVEHIMIPRVKGDKSLVDISLAVGACKEYYENHITSFILVSSDSDYWGLINGLPSCRFLVLIEKEKTSSAIKEAMDRNSIVYAYIDDFCSGNLEKIQSEALLLELRLSLNQYSVDLNQLLQKAIINTRVELSEDEIHQFQIKYFKKISLSQNDGVLKFEI